MHFIIILISVVIRTNSILNLSVSVELSAKDPVELKSIDPVASKRLKLVIRWLHPTTGDDALNSFPV